MDTQNSDSIITKTNAELGNCPHENLPKVEFDPELAQGLDSYEVKKRWPRGYYTCSDCLQQVITYASFEHYIMGDW